MRWSSKGRHGQWRPTRRLEKPIRWRHQPSTINMDRHGSTWWIFHFRAGWVGKWWWVLVVHQPSGPRHPWTFIWQWPSCVIFGNIMGAKKNKTARCLLPRTPLYCPLGLLGPWDYWRFLSVLDPRRTKPRIPRIWRSNRQKILENFPVDFGECPIFWQPHFFGCGCRVAVVLSACKTWNPLDMFAGFVYAWVWRDWRIWMVEIDSEYFSNRFWDVHIRGHRAISRSEPSPFCVFKNPCEHNTSGCGAEYIVKEIKKRLVMMPYIYIQINIYIYMPYRSIYIQIIYLIDAIYVHTHKDL